MNVILEMYLLILLKAFLKIVYIFFNMCFKEPYKHKSEISLTIHKTFELDFGFTTH